jgi:hypothetical protein
MKEVSGNESEESEVDESEEDEEEEEVSPTKGDNKTTETKKGEHCLTILLD